MTGWRLVNCLRSCCCCCCKKKTRGTKKLFTVEYIKAHENNMYEEISSKIPASPTKTAEAFDVGRNKNKNVYIDNERLMIKKIDVTNENDEDNYSPLSEEYEDNLYEEFNYEKDEEKENNKFVSIRSENSHHCEAGNLYEIMPTSSLESSPLIQRKQQQGNRKTVKTPLESGINTYEVPDYDEEDATYENTNNHNNVDNSNINNNNNNSNHHYTNTTQHSFRSKFDKIKGQFDLGRAPSSPKKRTKNRASPPSETAARSTFACSETNVEGRADTKKSAEKTSRVDDAKKQKYNTVKPCVADMIKTVENPTKRVHKTEKPKLTDKTRVTENEDDTKRFSRSLGTVDVKKFKALFEQN